MTNNTPSGASSTAPNIYEPLQQIDSSSAGSVSRPTWNANAGWDRQQQVEQERQKEWAEYQERLELNDPNQIRFLKLEAAVAELQKELKELRGK